MTKAYLTPVSYNRKTGPIPVSTTEENTCPPSCPLNGHGCYAQAAPMLGHWRKVSGGKGHYSGVEWPEFCRQVAALPQGQLWRHNQAGDLPGVGEAIDGNELARLVVANQDRRGFTFTHKPTTERNVGMVQCANIFGFTINWSAHSPEQADEFARLDAGPVVLIVAADGSGPDETPDGRPIRRCPATLGTGVTCATCGICYKANRKSIIAFPAHGSSARKAEETVR